MVSLITDRTDLDVRNKTRKGVYSASDLNRVETAVAELFEAIQTLAIPVPKDCEIVTKTNWSDVAEKSVVSLPVACMISSEGTRYLTNVAKLAKILNIEKSVILPSSMDRLTYEGANNIEKALIVIDALIASISDIWIYCGEIECGEDEY